jgi:hypothetical protein
MLNLWQSIPSASPLIAPADRFHASIFPFLWEKMSYHHDQRKSTNVEQVDTGIDLASTFGSRSPGWAKAQFGEPQM